MALTRTHFAYRIDLWTDYERRSSSIWPTLMILRLRWRPTMPPSNVGMAGRSP
jgi:hypothetical protein